MDRTLHQTQKQMIFSEQLKEIAKIKVHMNVPLSADQLNKFKIKSILPQMESE